ncbi:hypothetical protein IWW55_006129, partial [Coemansia sp. RSA 2706]
GQNMQQIFILSKASASSTPLPLATVCWTCCLPQSIVTDLLTHHNRIPALRLPWLLPTSAQ